MKGWTMEEWKNRWQMSWESLRNEDCWGRGVWSDDLDVFCGWKNKKEVRFGWCCCRGTTNLCKNSNKSPKGNSVKCAKWSVEIYHSILPAFIYSLNIWWPQIVYFADFLLGTVEMSTNEDDAAAQMAAAVPTGPPRFFKLPDFLTASPAAWFGVTEVQFLLRGTTSERDCFALVATVLPEASAHRVTNILAAPGDNCYEDLRAALL